MHIVSLIFFVALALVGVAMKARGAGRGVIVLLAVIAMGFLVSLWLRSDPIDRCLGRGGRWNAAMKRCEGMQRMRFDVRARGETLLHRYEGDRVRDATGRRVAAAGSRVGAPLLLAPTALWL